MRTLSIEQAHKELSSIIAAGEPVIVERDGIPIAKIAPSKMTPEFREETLEELAEIVRSSSTE
jgi:antitoxin (DNA-binding transcriptional repressor) of toxin-antitoxin stability system